MTSTAIAATPPYTQALRRALERVSDSRSVADLLFLEAWQINRPLELGFTLRASQIRRANPVLAAEITAELKAG